MTSQLRWKESWQLRGLTSQDKGLLGVDALPVRLLFKPSVLELIDGRISWGDDSEEAGSAEGLLDAFVRIKSDRDALRFARRWGPLGICAHGYPNTHGFIRDSAFDWLDALPGTETGECLPLDPPGSWDPADKYVAYASSVRSILNLAADLHAGAIGQRIDWEQASLSIFPANWLEGDAWVPDHVDAGKFYLAELISEWMRVGGVSLRQEWAGRDPTFFFLTGSFGAIGIQLMQAVNRSHGLTVCSSCGQVYMRKGRKPQAGRRNYCPDCGSAASLRDAQRAHRARRSQGRGTTES